MTKMTISLEAAQDQFAQLIAGLTRGDELIITQGDQVLARIVGERPAPGWKRPGPGLAKGMISIVSEDDDHLKDFAEYMS